MKDTTPKKETEAIEYPVFNIVGFDEKNANEMKTLAELNNAYIALMQQYEQAKRNINVIKENKKNVEVGEIKVEDLYVPFGAGLIRKMRHDEKDTFLKIHNDALRTEEIKINAIIGQLQHKADSLGEQRMRVFRILYSILEGQHNFKKEDLIKILSGLENVGFKNTDKVFDKIQSVMEQVKNSA